MKAVKKATEMHSLAVRWLSYDSVRGKLSLGPTSRNICATGRDIEHQMKLHVLTSVPLWQLRPTWVSARVAASSSLSKHFPEGSSPTSPSTQALPDVNLSFFTPPPLSSPPSIEPVLAKSLIISAIPLHLPPVNPAAIVAATHPLSNVPAGSAGILIHVPAATVPHIFFRVSADVPTTAIASSVSTFLMVSFTGFVASASVPVFSVSTAVRQCSHKPVVANH